MEQLTDKTAQVELHTIYYGLLGCTSGTSPKPRSGSLWLCSSFSVPLKLTKKSYKNTPNNSSRSGLAGGSSPSVLTVVVDYQVTVAVDHEASLLIVAELCQGVGEDQALKGLTGAHQAANDVAAVGGGESGDSGNLDHVVFLLDFWALLCYNQGGRGKAPGSP